MNNDRIEQSWASIERMVQDLEEGILSETEHALLMRMITDEPEVRRLYFDHMETVAMLKETVKNREKLRTLPVSDEMLQHQRHRSALFSFSLGLAALLVLGLGFFAIYLNHGPATDDRAITMESSSDASYSVSYSGDQPRSEGNLRAGDRIALSSGLSRLTFPSGVEAIVEGPSEMLLISELSLKMEGGLAWFRVPEAGRGFTVQTERASIIDLGTEFGVWFDGEEGLQVHVAKGKVRVEPALKAMAKVELVADDAMVFDVFGRGRSVKSRHSLFRRQFTRSMPYVHWSFDDLVDGSYAADGNMPGVETYQAKLTHLQGESRLADLEKHQTNGRFGGAFSMDGNGLFAQTAFPGIGGNAPRTFAAWIRHRNSYFNDGARTPYCVWGDRAESDEGAWKIMMWKGAPHVLLTASLESPASLHGSSPVSEKTARQWMHIASVYTGRNDERGNPEIHHYINGKRQRIEYKESATGINTATVNSPTALAKPVRFGAAIHDLAGVHTVDGDMDEAYLFRGALTEKQVRQLMEENSLDFFVK